MEGRELVYESIMGMRNQELMRKKRKSQRYREVTDGNSARIRIESSIT